MTSHAVQQWPGVVIVSGPGLRAAADAVLIAIRSRRLSGLPHSKIHDDLAAAFLEASGTGHVDVPNVVIPATSPTVSIEEAAHRMGLSSRQVRRLAPRLGGRIVSGRWLLDDTAVTEHIEGKS
ncbi:hypothetical protein [Mycobacterium neumannii]|uniref:hypothetical protein n=1 Tax=Mycobacterium neumannii TaxID=2048551 RepID=UPI000B941D02|nr:hypothetical protein [Mycobacterium neumannii]